MNKELSKAIQEYPLDFPEIRDWLNQCPTCWNAEYSEEAGMFCFYICPPAISPSDFLELFE